MNREMEYRPLYTSILNEHKAVFEKLDVSCLNSFMNAINEFNRIFLLGVGREGMVTRAFAMRLMHLGKDVHWIWDDTTPNIQEGDLVIITSGSGQIGHLHYIAERAKKAGATLLIVTGSPEQMTPALADIVFFVPACVYLGTDDRVIDSIQPMGNLFEQSLLLLFDMIILLLVKENHIPYAEMVKRHRNIE